MTKKEPDIMNAIGMDRIIMSTPREDLPPGARRHVTVIKEKPAKTAKNKKKTPPPRGAAKKKARTTPRVPRETPWTPGEAALDKPETALTFDNLKRVSAATAQDAAQAKKTGRPSKLTPAVHQVVIVAIRLLGFSDADAASLVGLTPPSVTHWLAQGEKDEQAARPSIYADFLNDHRASATTFETVHRANIASAARGTLGKDGKPVVKADWRASDRLLEIQNRRKYGRRVEIGLEGFDMKAATDEQLRRILAGLPPD